MRYFEFTYTEGWKQLDESPLPDDGWTEWLEHIQDHGWSPRGHEVGDVEFGLGYTVYESRFDDNKPTAYDYLVDVDIRGTGVNVVFCRAFPDLVALLRQLRDAGFGDVTVEDGERSPALPTPRRR